MLLIHKITLYSHIFIGFISLILFWVPVFAKKGSPLHNRVGGWFVNAIWVVSISGIIMSLIVWWDPLAIRLPVEFVEPGRAAKIINSQRTSSEFLLMLSLLVLVSVKQAMLVLKVRTDRSRLRKWHHLMWIFALILLAMVIGTKGFIQGHILLMIFGPIGLSAGLGALKYIYKSELKSREWILEHFSNIIGCGIGVYTAFFAFGGRAFMQELLPGALQVIPWIVPGIAGTLAIVLYKPKYTKLYRVKKSESKYSAQETLETTTQ
ncbi:MAG: hypothetical protein HWE27_12345 [Gammaproteobacteria bacterium]|nr:hypothetical protein [Gammaproteobacteria bacterium]